MQFNSLPLSSSFILSMQFSFCLQLIYHWQCWCNGCMAQGPWQLLPSFSFPTPCFPLSSCLPPPPFSLSLGPLSLFLWAILFCCNRYNLTLQQPREWGSGSALQSCPTVGGRVHCWTKLEMLWRRASLRQVQIRFHVEHQSIYSSCRAVWQSAVLPALCHSSLPFSISFSHRLFPPSPLCIQHFMSPLVFRPPSQFSLFPVSARSVSPVSVFPPSSQFLRVSSGLQSNSSPSPFLPSSQNSVRFVSDGHRPRVQLPFLNRNCFPSFQLPFLQSRPVFNLPAFFPTFL